jgi:hypothetical protein
MQQTQQVAGQAVEGAKQQAVSALWSQKHQASHNLSAMSDALEQAGQSMRQQNLGMAGDVMDQAATRVDRLAGYLHDNEIGDIVQDVESYGRRNPAIFLGGAFALGLLAARFLKSSPQPETQITTTGVYGTSTTPYGYGDYTSTGPDAVQGAGQPQGSYNYQNVPHRYEDVQGVPYVERRYTPGMMDSSADINVDETQDLTARLQEQSYGNASE